MRRLNFNYSLKNIAIPTKSAYCLKVIDQIESVIKRMRWKAFFFLTCNSSNANSNNCDNVKETSGFKSKNHPAQINELKNFEKQLVDIIPSIKLRDIRDKFQTKMKNDISKRKSYPIIFVPADKTTNMYEMPPDNYKKLLYENITKTYKKSTSRLENSINMEAKYIPKKIKLDDRIECLANTPAFITLKDHQENFRTVQPCRVINTSKSELGKISKTILEKVNKSLVDSLKVNR